jgi:putative ABC transport system permease protein
MARFQRAHWLLIRVAAQNVARNRLRAILLGVAVMLGVGIGFASFVAGWAVRTGIATSLSRMGADLAVVPRETLVNITSSLLTVQPTDSSLDSGIGRSIAAIPGIAGVASQRIVRSVIGGQAANLIAFDPSTDFSILSWLGEHQAGLPSLNDVITGGRVPAHVGDVLQICGKSFVVYGRLELTGVGPFDESYFLSFDALSAINALNHVPGAQQSGGKGPDPFSGEQDPALAGADINLKADGCKADLPLNRVSAFLLQLSSGAKVEDVKFSIAQLLGVRIIEGNTAQTNSRQALGPLFLGIVISVVFQVVALMIVVSLLFSAIVQERYREVGLLRAMGARSKQIMTIILAEAVIVTGLGGVAGLIFATTLLLVFSRSLGFYFGLFGIPFSWPPLAFMEECAALTFLFSVLLGLVGAFLPVWRIRGLDPYALIHAHER